MEYSLKSFTTCLAINECKKFNIHVRVKSFPSFFFYGPPYIARYPPLTPCKKLYANTWNNLWINTIWASLRHYCVASITAFITVICSESTNLKSQLLHMELKRPCINLWWRCNDDGGGRSGTLWIFFYARALRMRIRFFFFKCVGFSYLSIICFATIEVIEYNSEVFGAAKRA